MYHLALIAVLLLAGCAHGHAFRPPRNAVLYTIGLSTDPYGNSRPRGFGVATGIVTGKLHTTEVRQRGLAAFNGAEWLSDGRIVVNRPAPPLRKPLLYRYGPTLEHMGSAPLPGGSAYAWSPKRRLFAYEPPRPCAARQKSLYSCYRGSRAISVVRADGSERRRVTTGHLMGWTSDGRVVFFRHYQRAIPEALDLRTMGTGPIVPGWRIDLPVWSPDHRYLAAVTGAGVVVARADGRRVQTIRSRFVLSMIAWSPVADRLAFTTSGFPDPHQLFVLDRPGGKPRLLYATGAVHFDWVTWSPDGRWLLLDEEHKHRWSLFRADRPGIRRTLSRLGGRPLWCCPVNSFGAGGTVRSS